MNESTLDDSRAPTPLADTTPAARVADDAPGRTIGRYEILERLGAGGMGIVYKARDPALDRLIALKVLPPLEEVSSANLETRLRREAQALARLDHPHVVTVYDVGVAEHSVFIAMRLVDGATLGDHISRVVPPPRERLAHYVAAGRGLAAAHAAGIVHRDFKPSNVLIDRSGHVFVGDFGLARGTSDTTGDDATSASENLLGKEITRNDAIVGTPRYMAPEQHHGRAVSPQADQFSFCIAVWEALFGVHPFAGDRPWSRAAALAAMDADRIVPPPRVPGIRARIQRALERGLRHDPAARWPSMDALLAELEPRSRTRWFAAGIAVAGIAGGALFAFAAGDLVGDRGANPCASAAAEIDRTWTPIVRAELYVAVAGRPLPDAPTLARRLVDELDTRTTAWRVMRLDTCEASSVRKTETAEITARRTACLARSLDGLHAAIELARTADDPTRANLVAAARAGTDPTECDAAGTLHVSTATVSPQLSQQLATLEAAGAAGRMPYVLATAGQLATELEAAGDLEGAARAYLVRVRTGGNQSTSAMREDARKAAVLAARAGDSALEARAWRYAAVAAAASSADGTFEELLAMAEAAAARSGKAAQVKLEIAVTRGNRSITERAFDKGIAACQRALDEGRTLFGEASPVEIDALACMYRGYYYTESWPDAIRISQLRLAKVRALDGDSSTRVLECMRQVAQAQIWSGQVEEGRATMRETIARETAVVGAESRHVLESWWRLAQAESRDGVIASEEGLAASQHAVAIAEKILPPDELYRATIFMTHGDVLSAFGKHDEALIAYEHVLEVFDRVDNPKRWGPVAYNVADGYVRAGRCDRALPILERMIALANAGRIGGSLGPTAVGLRGTCGVREGRVAAGIKDLDEAIAQCDRLTEIEFAAQFRLEVAKAYTTLRDRGSARRRLREVLDKVPADDNPVHRQLRTEATKLLR